MDYAEMRDRTRAAWSEGNYPELAPVLMGAATELVDACAISAGQEVLDVAAGNGNAATAAAREGATVVASDLTPAMIEQGRARTEAEGVDVQWVEADAERLPFAEARFDCVTSVFGAMFAPHPETVAEELFRVVTPGGTVGMANWTPESFPGRLFALIAAYLPPPPGVPRPVEWGVEETVRRRFDGLASRVTLERRILRWEFETPAAMVDFFDRNGPPNAVVRKSLEADRYEAMREDQLNLVSKHNSATDGSVAVDAEYLLVVARKRG